MKKCAFKLILIILKIIGNSNCVFTPENESQLSQILRYCYKRNLGIVSQSRNIGLTGGSVPNNYFNKKIWKLFLFRCSFRYLITTLILILKIKYFRYFKMRFGFLIRRFRCKTWFYDAIRFNFKRIMINWWEFSYKCRWYTFDSIWLTS